MTESVLAFGPASIANVGPFYDVMGYCLNYLGDFVEAKKTSEHRAVRLTAIKGPYAKELEAQSVKLSENCVQIVAEYIWDDFNKNFDYGVDLVLFKYMPTRSGLGSSAASAVATTKAILTLIGQESSLDRQTINNYIMSGEQKVSDHYYPDNIVPSYWGGFSIISPYWQEKVPTPDFATLVILPADTVKTNGIDDCVVRRQLHTGAQRKKVDEHFRKLITDEGAPGRKIEKIMEYIRFQSSNAARLIHAIYQQDIEKIGHVISETNGSFLYDSRDSETSRASIWAIAEKMGALGCSVSGSGPAIFLITSSINAAEKIRNSLLGSAGFTNAYWIISGINENGATLCRSLDAAVKEGSNHHNFWMTE